MAALLALAALALSADYVSQAPARMDTGGPAQLLARAAGDLSLRLAPGGQGLSFEVLQRQSPVLGPMAPSLPVALPGSDGKPASSAYMTRGFARGTDFYMAIRAVDPALATPTFEGGLPLFEAIASGGRSWRQEGEGFYETAVLPGLGIDPVSLARFPDLLRHLAGPVDVGEDTVGGEQAHHLRGTASVADWPGFIATDAAGLTASPFTVEVWLATDGRLLALEGSTRNLSEPGHDLEVSDRITFGTAVPERAPDPSPLRPAASPLASSPPSPVAP